MSYEWKNIYRSVLSTDILSKGKITASKFNQICLGHNVTLTKEEIRRLVKLSRPDVGEEIPLEDVMNKYIDYRELSNSLGLHKASFNLMSVGSKASEKNQ